VAVVLATVRSVMVAGGMPGVVAQLEFETAAALARSSRAFSAKQYVVSGDRPLASKRSR